jgi:hypothetical protein
MTMASFEKPMTFPFLDPMRDGIAKPWGVISPSTGPATSGAFFNSPDRFLWRP